ncbi:hypothetical protein [Paenibacillus sp. TH7-28]
MNKMAVTQEIGIPIDLTKGTFVNTEIKDGKLQLREVGIDDNGNSIFVDTGHWESEIINIKDKFTAFKRVARDVISKGSGSYKIYTQSSTDRITWTDYVEINYSDGSILSPVGLFARIKIEITANRINSTRTVDDFNEQGKYNNDYLNISNGYLEFKKNYVLDGVKDEAWTNEGKVFVSYVEKSKFKKVINLSRAEV